MGGAALGVLPGGWFPLDTRPAAGARLEVLVIGGDNELRISGLKSTGVLEDLVIRYAATTGAQTFPPVILGAITDGTFSASIPAPLSTGYIVSVVAATTRAFAMGQATVA